MDEKAIVKLEHICKKIGGTPELSSNEESQNALERDALLTDILNELEDLIVEIKRRRKR